MIIGLGLRMEITRLNQHKRHLSAGFLFVPEYITIV